MAENERASSINLSDGGHIENLGAYELIRRKLKFIVCVDGGMDADMDCTDLNRLQRLAAIDFGYRIEFDAADLKLVDKFSTSYGMLVKIDYTPQTQNVAQKELGWMLYIKLAMLGKEAPNSRFLDRSREPAVPAPEHRRPVFRRGAIRGVSKARRDCGAKLPSTQFDTEGVDDFREWFQKVAGYLLRDTDQVYHATDRAPSIALASVGT